MSPDYYTEKTCLFCLPVIAFRAGYCLLHSLKMALTPWSDSLFYGTVTYRSAWFQILKETNSMGVICFWPRDGTELKYTAGRNILSTWPLIEGPSDNCSMTFEYLFHPSENFWDEFKEKNGEMQTLPCPVSHCLLLFFPRYPGNFFVDGRFCSYLLY